MQLDQHTALVVGGGQTPGATESNGRAVALFAKAGAKVAVADRKLESAEETAQQIIAAGGEAITIALNVRDEDEVKQAVAATCTFGRIDVLHNNVGVAAGAGHRDARIEQIEAGRLFLLVDVNLRGMVLTCKHALPVSCVQRVGAWSSI